MLRFVLIAATVFATGCPSSGPPSKHPQPIVDDTAVRVRIARAEAARAGGVAELVQLCDDPAARALALRGLGRIGSDTAIATLLAHTADPDPSPAYAALGVAASLDDTAPLVGKMLPSLQDDRQMIAVVEAFGRAAGTNEQKLITTAVRDRSPQVVAAGALALGRMARRKLAFEPVARDWLAAKTKDPDPAVRYAATYSLAREFQAPDNPAVIAALTQRISDADAETRAAAIGGLAKRGVVTLPALAEALRDRDWRVAVEAVRALGGEHATPALRDLVVNNLARRWAELVAGHGAEAQVINEALHQLVAHPELTAAGTGDVVAFTGKLLDTVPARPGVSPLVDDWIGFVDGVAMTALVNQVKPEAFTAGSFPRHLRFTLAEDAFPHGDVAFQRTLMRAMLESTDPRERAAGFGVLATAKAFDRDVVSSTLAAGVSAKDPVISGAAADAIGTYYKTNATNPQLDAALVARAAVETEPELASGLYETIGTYKIAAGADACRAGLTRHPIAARAAAACLKALGQAVATPAIGVATAPPVDVATVIGKRVTWHVKTTTGDLTIELRPDIAPWNVATIVELTRRGFYNGIEFHRVVADFVVQGGDPTMSGGSAAPDSRRRPSPPPRWKRPASRPAGSGSPTPDATAVGRSGLRCTPARRTSTGATPTSVRSPPARRPRIHC